MVTKNRIFSLVIAMIISFTCVCPSVLAREFSPAISTNIGVKTQYAYDENDPSWLRQLTVKEDMLSVSGIINEKILYPVLDYPYTADAPFFKAQVDEYVELYSLDENSQKAAYLYLLKQFNALNIISSPETSDESKADWLRKQGIVITEEDEKDPDKVLMIGALYALMKNDLYYVYTGKHLTIPPGTPLEEAIVMYFTAMEGNDSKLSEFMSKFFGGASITNLDDYAYYTALVTLYTQGYVAPAEIPTITREEVYRRLAIMTIHNAGVAIDAETATTEEIYIKYLTVMLGSQYQVTLDPALLEKALTKSTVPYYLLQRMAYEDANVTISQTAHTYEECFEIVLQKTDRFKLEEEFYSDVHEYDVHLENARESIYINPNHISKTGQSIFINGVEVSDDTYSFVKLNGSEKETITIVSRYTENKKTSTTSYKLNVYQGKTPAPDSELTGIIATMGDMSSLPNGSEEPTNAPADNQSPQSPQSPGNQQTPVTPQNPQIPETLQKPNTTDTVTFPSFDGLLSMNEDGQLVDRNGNIVSDSTYETPSGNYNNSSADNGFDDIFIASPNGTTETTSIHKEETDEEKVLDIVTIVSLVCFIAILIAIIVIIILAKKRSKMTEKEKAKRRTKKKGKKRK